VLLLYFLALVVIVSRISSVIFGPFKTVACGTLLLRNLPILIVSCR
jgi:hypothetical protein